MTSHDTPTGSAKPSIIDLEAETVSDEPGVQEPLPPSPPPATRRNRSRWLWSALALGIAAAAGAWLYKEALAGYFPSDTMQLANSRIETLEAQTKTLNDQLTALANQSEQLKGTIGNAQATVETAAAQAHEATAKATDVETRIAATESAQLELKSQLSKLSVPAAGTPVDSNALAAFAQRLDALEKDVASLKAQRAPADTASTTAALSQALADLKAKIATGAQFQNEYDRLARMVPAAAGLDVLKARAATGLPSAQGLATELRNQIDLLPKPAAPAPEEEGYFAGLWSALGSVVTIKDIGEADLPAVSTRAADLAEAGDVTGAIALIDGIEGEKPMILTQWRERASQRLALEQASDQVSTAVLQQITSMGTTQ